MVNRPDAVFRIRASPRRIASTSASRSARAGSRPEASTTEEWVVVAPARAPDRGRRPRRAVVRCRDLR